MGATPEYLLFSDGKKTNKKKTFAFLWSLGFKKYRQLCSKLLKIEKGLNIPSRTSLVKWQCMSATPEYLLFSDGKTFSLKLGIQKISIIGNSVLKITTATEMRNRLDFAKSK